ncbi:MAG: nucleotidyltransferase family protein [Clostridia bacterium]|nr:nucleotidyltransferase family protein [Clostridia bacterium]
MTIEQAYLLKLISLSQFRTGVDGSEAPVNAVPEGIDWVRLYEEAMAQSVVCVTGSVLPDNVPADVRSRWKDAENRQLVTYIRYLNAQSNLTALLREKQIPFAVLKGLAAAVNYRDPSKRAMGDIDFIVPPEMFEQTREVLLAEGYQPVDYGVENIRHVAYDKGRVHFELHHHFGHEDREEVEKYVTNGLAKLREACVDNAEFTMLDRLGNGVVLLDHMKTHLKSGLGLRQAVDWMMYVDRELDDEFWTAEFEAAAADVRLVKFAKVATRMCQKYMGLRTEGITWCSDADDKLCDDLIENLLISGNFGRRNGEGQKIESITASIKREGLFTRLQKSGEGNWQAYKKHKWLKPFCWIYQSGRYVRQGIRARRSGSELKDDFKRAKTRHKLLKDLEII